MQFSDAKDWVGKRLHNTSTNHLSKIGDDLNWVKDDIITRRNDWEWMSTDSTFDTVADDFDYDITNLGGNSDIAHIMTMRIEDERRKLTAKDAYWFDEVRAANPERTGEPFAYIEAGDELLLYPTPDAVYTVQFRYYKFSADLSADADTPPWPTRFDRAWLLGAWALGYQFTDDQRFATLWGLYEKAIREIATVDQIVDEEILASSYSEPTHFTLPHGFDESRF